MWKPTSKNSADFVQMEVKEFKFGGLWSNHSRFEVSAQRNKVNVPNLKPGVSAIFTTIT